MRAPYNFVPLTDKVYFPKWAKNLSHDVPFSDGISGTIELEIVARSPIFVRNGHTNEDNERATIDYKSFSRTSDGRYFIPATSIKGSIRSIVEIMSSGKMRLDENQKFAQREWGNDKLYSLKGKQDKFKCGWLKWDAKESVYYIEDCGKPYRIAHTKLDDYFKSQGKGRDLFRNKFSRLSGFDLTVDEVEYENNIYDPKSAAYKYALTKGVNLRNLKFETDSDYVTSRRSAVKICEEGDLEGCIVFTGQPNQWVDPRPQTKTSDAGKFYDFVFKNSVENKHCISEIEFKKYESIYSKSPDWKLWIDKINGDGIPVFFRLNEQKKIQDWGLAFLYKLPYDKTPYETLPSDHHEDDYDLADCIFGSIKSNGVKGRVYFGNAFWKKQEGESDDPRGTEVRLVLSSPKASYYPIYVKQRGNNGIVTQYKTYNDGVISGWKRYPIRNGVWGTSTGLDKLDTILYPLKENTHFVSVIKFHNLKTVELGALLSALSFHSDKNCFHQLGQGKPFGYGKVEISSVLHINDERYNAFPKEVYMAHFEDEMSKEHYPINNPSVKKLIALSKSNVSGQGYEYMVMSNNPRENEFSLAKNRMEYLLPFVDEEISLLYPKYEKQVNEMREISAMIKEKIAEHKRIIELEKEKMRREKEILRQKEYEQACACKEEADKLAKDQKYNEAIEKYKFAYEILKEDAILCYIDECKSKQVALEKEEKCKNDKYGVSFDELLNNNIISSIPAFSTCLEKWMNHNNHVLNDNEKQRIKEKLNNTYQQLKKADKKKWENKKGWDNINKLLGEDLYGDIIHH